MKIYNDTLIKKWEKLRLKAYLPTPDDVWTIGWGHTKGVEKGMVITKAQAEQFFDEDTAWVEAAIAKHIKVPLSQNQYDAVASWIFNVGESKASKSTLIKKLNAKDYEGAAREFPRWNKQEGKVLKGLTRRRAEEMSYFLEGSADQKAPPNATPDNEPQHPPIYQSKETLGGLIVALVGASVPILKGPTDVVIVLMGAFIVLVGGGIIARKIFARKKGEH